MFGLEFRRGARKWDRYIAQILENKFWRMFVGKEPALPGLIDQFIYDLKQAVISSKWSYCKASSRGEEGWLIDNYKFSKSLVVMAIIRFCQNRITTLTYCEEELLSYFFSQYVYSSSTYILNASEIAAEHRPCLDWDTLEYYCISNKFIDKITIASFESVEDLIFREPEEPTMRLSDIPRRYWTKRMIYWADLISDPIEWDLYKAWEGIERLKKMGSSPENLKELAKLEYKAYELAIKERAKFSADPNQEIVRKNSRKQWLDIAAAINTFLNNAETDRAYLLDYEEKSIKNN